MVIVTFYRGHDDLLGKQKLKTGQWFHPDEISDPILGWIVIQFCTNNQSPQRMKPSDTEDLLTFILVPLWGWHFCFFSNYGIDRYLKTLVVLRWCVVPAGDPLTLPLAVQWCWHIYILKQQVLATAAGWTAMKCSNHIHIPPRLDCSNFGDPVTKTPTSLT